MNALNVNDEVASIIRSKLPNAMPSEFIRYGTHKGKQVYRHKPTGKQYIANDALPRRRIPPAVVGDAITSFYDGLSYRDIQRRIQANHGFAPSTATLYEWVRDYSEKARHVLNQTKAETGGVLVADEMVVKVDGKNHWLWNIMDKETRFLLATHISPTRTITDVQVLLRKAMKRTDRIPSVIQTDGMSAYPDGIERVFGRETKHIVTQGIASRDFSPNLIERLNGTIRERTKVMRGMETRLTAEQLMDGFQIHYNHMKPHHALNGRTPAHAAGLNVGFNDWVDVARLQGDKTALVPDNPLQDTRLTARHPKPTGFRTTMFSIRRRRW